MISIKKTSLRISSYVPTNMTMSVLFILAFKIIFVPFASTDSGIPCAICSFLGVENELTHKMKVEEIPSCCKVINFGAYYFNETQSKDNTELIGCLVNGNFEVVTTLAATKYWNDILTTDTYDTEIEKMAQYMTDNQISTVFLDLNVNTYDLGITDIASKVNTLVCKIKATAPTLKVGLTLNAVQFNKFGSEDLFSFTTTNCAIDIYNIFTGDIGIPCWEAAGMADSLPLSSNEDSKYVSLDQVCQGVAASCMDQEKIIIDLSMFVGVGMAKEQKNGMALEYPQYCCLGQTDSTAGTNYCPDSLEIYQKRASYIKDYAKGIFIFNLDYDYWNDDCGCERYLITTTMMKAFGCN